MTYDVPETLVTITRNNSKTFFLIFRFRTKSNKQWKFFQNIKMNAKRIRNKL